MKRTFILLISLLLSAVGFSQCETDSVNPWFEGYQPEPTISCDGDLSTLIPLAYDACDTLVEIAIYEEIFAGSCPGNYDIFRIYRAFDDNGNGVIASQMIHVVDETVPQISGILDLIEVDCNSSYTISQPSFSDNCSGISETDLNIESYVNPNNLEESAYIWSATDGCGNVSHAQTIVRYVDKGKPWFVNFPDDATISCDAEIPPVVYPQVLDSCDTYLPIEFSEEFVHGDCPNRYTIIRTFRAYDDSGNSITDSQTINIVDNQAPEFANMTNDILEMCTYTQPPSPSVWDNCGTVDLTWEQTTIDSISDCNYLSLITWEATDNCGNVAYASQTIQIMDVTPPVITGDIYIEIQGGESIDTVMIEYSDNCSSVTITYSDMDVSGNNIIRNYMATDGCGNSSTFEQIINISTITPPDGGEGGDDEDDDDGEDEDNDEDDEGSEDDDDDNDDEDDDDEDDDDEEDEDNDGDDNDDEDDEEDEDNDEDDNDDEDNNKVAICHRTGDGSYHTIYVAPQAVQAHLAHGDYLGPCTEIIIDWQTILPNSDLEMRVIKGYDNQYKKIVRVK